jgi:DNA-directed RNA polymerase specialized sigma24 family protein
VDVKRGKCCPFICSRYGYLRLMRVCKRMGCSEIDAQDIVQEAFERYL